ncbi:hypothetical protein C1Y41_05845 [Pantoea sp. ICBG 1758]|uniref:hypothetical protein n=1 Tax=Pantoea sp. ICBG 1758 TaxID=2071682 RepID=UPI000CE56A00|nr:hypothetical protein [Pantoea sp. ICBG 1758]PPC64159.1 hypothetical protein C1Y41_05845 [Pantoea sp. ICBG 1758]
MNIDKQIVKFFNTFIEEAEFYSYLARSSHLQLEQCFILDEVINRATGFKLNSIKFLKEKEANCFLGYECVIGAVRSELLMWILIKMDKPNEAWEKLVAAQMGYLDASRADKGFSNCRKRKEVLEGLEDKVFPSQAFVSAGFSSERIDCSICGERYSKCVHLRGKAYMGQFCEVIHRNPRGDHIALVDSPADKRCRIISIKKNGGYQDKLSGMITPYEDGEVYIEGGSLEANCNILNFERYPYLTPTKKSLGDLLSILESKNKH